MKILIATDGSEFSDEAIEKCCQMLISASETNVKVVSVYQEVLPLDAFPQSLEYAEALEKKARIDAESFVATAAAKINERFPDSSISVETIVKTGSPDQAILEIAKEWTPDAIVVGSHGRGFWGRATLGSISDSIVHHAPCSVLVVRKIE